MGLSKAHCRRCWKEAARLAGPWNTKVLLHEDTVFGHHQLALIWIAVRMPGRRPRPFRPSQAVAVEPATDTAAPGDGQLALFTAVPGVLVLRPPSGIPSSPLGRPGASPRPRGLTGQEPTLSPRCQDILARVLIYAQAHGWSPAHRGEAKDMLTRLWQVQPVDEPITAALLNAYSHGQGGGGRLLRTLVELGVQPDQRNDLPRILQRTVEGLPATIAEDVTAWLTELHGGGHRARPRSAKTVHEYADRTRRWLVPWACAHASLREFTPAHGRQILAGATKDTERRNLFVALRSLFRFLKRTRRTFTDPMAGIHLGGRAGHPIVPLSEDDYDRVSAHARTPVQRLALFLAAVLAAGPGEIRNLRLEDVDLATRRITLGGQRRELDDTAVAVLTQWMAYRNTTWPLTANPYLIITRPSSKGIDPVSATYLRSLFTGTGIPLERLRRDRLVDEALTYGPDPLHLSALFGISQTTAVTYSDNARRILELPPPGSASPALTSDTQHHP
jgi:hypothetical protein